MKDKIEFFTKELKVKIQSGKIAASRSGELYKFGIRDFQNGLLKSASAIGEVPEESLAASLKESELLKVSAKDQMPSSNRSGHWNFSKTSISSVTELSQMANGVVDRLYQRLPHFALQGHLKEIQEETTYSNSLGARLNKTTKNHELLLEFRRNGSPNICDYFFYYNDTGGFNLDESFEFTVHLLEAYDNEIEIPSGKYNVLMAPTSPIINKVGESLRSDKYSEGSALYSGKLGQPLFDDRVSFSDFRNSVKLGGTNPFDYEGSVNETEKTALIKDGKMIGLISDIKHQNKYGLETTANGFRKYNSQVKLDFSNLNLERGQKSAMDLLKSQDEAIVSLMAIGGDLTEDGNFSTPMQLAFLVRDGKVVGRIKNLAASTHLNHFFGDGLIEISNTSIEGAVGTPFCLVNMVVNT